MICPKCNQTIPDKSRFCPFCKTKISRIREKIPFFFAGCCGLLGIVFSIAGINLVNYGMVGAKIKGLTTVFQSPDQLFIFWMGVCVLSVGVFSLISGGLYALYRKMKNYSGK